MASVSTWWKSGSFDVAREAEAKVLAFAGQGIPGFQYKIYDVPIRSDKDGVPVVNVGAGAGASAGASVEASDFIHTAEFFTPTSRIPLVIAHGFGAGLGFFFKNYGELAKTFHIYAFDWIGMGLSSRPKWNCSTPEEAEEFFVAELEQWRIRQNLTTFVLMGHSLGGFLSTVYSLKYPQHVLKLLLVSPVGVPHPVKRDDKNTPMIFKVARKLWDMDVTPQGVVRTFGPWGPSLINKFATRRFGLEVITPEQSEALQEYMYLYFRLPPCGEYAMNTILAPGAFARIPLHDRLPHLKVEAAFVYGSKDWMDPQAARNVAPLMRPEPTIHIVDDAGHHLYMDNTTVFDRVLIDLCRDVIPPKGYPKGDNSIML